MIKVYLLILNPVTTQDFTVNIRPVYRLFKTMAEIATYLGVDENSLEENVTLSLNGDPKQVVEIEIESFVCHDDETMEIMVRIDYQNRIYTKRTTSLKFYPSMGQGFSVSAGWYDGIGKIVVDVEENQGYTVTSYMLDVPQYDYPTLHDIQYILIHNIKI